MTIAAIIIGWYVLGVLLLIWGLYLVDPVILGKDLVFAAVFGVVGPMNLFPLVMAAISRPPRRKKPSWLDKQVWPRPRQISGDA
jgi:hypothetical protein